MSSFPYFDASVSVFRRLLRDYTILLEFYKGLYIRITSLLILMYSKKYINRGVIDSEEG
jgi:hypothetical protein